MFKIARNRKKIKISKKKVIRFVIIVVLILVVIIVNSVMKIKKIVEKDQEILADLDDPNVSDFDRVMDKYEVDVKDKTPKVDELMTQYNVDFKYDLYEGEENKEDYYISLIEELNEVSVYNYKLRDERKNITIISKKDEETGKFKYTINGEEDYFGKNNKNIEILNNYKEIEKEPERIYTEDVNSISSSGWNFASANMGKYKLIDGQYVSEDNAKLEIGNLTINRIILNSDYQKDIVKGIRVGTDFETIKEKLGEPTFEIKEKDVIGYKLSDSYIYFYKDKAIVYPNMNYMNYSFEKMIFDYYEGADTIDRSRFANKILTEYVDFDSKLDGDILILTSIARQIEIRIDNNRNMGITVFNGYNLGRQMKNYIRDGKINARLDEDFTYVYEKNVMD